MLIAFQNRSIHCNKLFKCSDVFYLFPLTSIIFPNDHSFIHPLDQWQFKKKIYQICYYSCFLLDRKMFGDFDLSNNSSHQANSLWNESFHSNTSLLFSFLIFFTYAIIFLIGFIANIFVIIVIIKCRRMRTLTNRFLLNLAISDLLATLICLPPTAYHHYDKRWIFGEFLCRFIPFIQGIFRRKRKIGWCILERKESNEAQVNEIDVYCFEAR